MNEQQAADLFSEQIDRLLGGEALAPIPGLDDWPELVTLGDQLSQVGFQPTPVAQAAFQSQMATWFGPAGGSSSATAFLGMSKNSLLGLGAAILALGAGLGLVLLTGTILPGLFSPDSEDDLPAVVTVESSASATPEVPARPAFSPAEATESPPDAIMPLSPAAAGDTLPDTNFSQKDTLPSATPLRGDTLPTATMTGAPTATATGVSPTSPATEYTDGEPGSTDTGEGPAQGNDDDRGHGNDPDRYDEDNPGKSTGAGQNNDPGGGSTGGGDRGGGKKK